MLTIRASIAICSIGLSNSATSFLIFLIDAFSSRIINRLLRSSKEILPLGDNIEPLPDVSDFITSEALAKCSLIVVDERVSILSGTGKFSTVSGRFIAMEFAECFSPLLK